MSRRDTIIIAVLVNAGILLVLFALAMPSKEETENISSVAEKVEIGAVSEEPGAMLTAVSDEKAVVVDEIDQVLSEWNEQASSAPTAQLAVEETDTATYPIAVPAKEELPAEKPSSAAKTVEVVVKKGDALDKIARAHGTSAQEIMKLNHLSSTKLQIGQVLLVPDSGKTKAKKAKASSSKSGAEYYTVKSGDNPWTIANKNHIKLDELLKLNDLNEDSAKKLKPGDKIKIK